jgi:hypothetical protein
MLSGANVIESRDNARRSFESGSRPVVPRLSSDDITTIQGVNSTPDRWPTLFDALRAAQGVTLYSDLKKVNVVRKQPLSQGGGKAGPIRCHPDGVIATSLQPSSLSRARMS